MGRGETGCKLGRRTEHTASGRRQQVVGTIRSAAGSSKKASSSGAHRPGAKRAQRQRAELQRARVRAMQKWLADCRTFRVLRVPGRGEESIVFGFLGKKTSGVEVARTQQREKTRTRQRDPLILSPDVVSAWAPTAQALRCHRRW